MAEFPLTIALGLIVRVAIETVAGTVEPVEFVGVLICPPRLSQPEINAVMTKIEMRNESWRDMNSPALIAVGECKRIYLMELSITNFDLSYSLHRPQSSLGNEADRDCPTRACCNCRFNITTRTNLASIYGSDFISRLEKD